ncbi:GNAT family N-acetyltransferase [Variibacter gotjawalensis]|uniref:GNAT family N-acetyltransferase n=1 Tax=Variibacter gotjawalensis TaxID=1333996 RepID=UPI0012FDCB6B
MSSCRRCRRTTTARFSRPNCARWTREKHATNYREALLGYAMLVPAHRAQLGQRVMDLPTSFVVLSARGQGVGRSLVAAARAKAERLGRLALAVGTHPDNTAQHFYKGQGFAAVVRNTVRLQTNCQLGKDSCNHRVQSSLECAFRLKAAVCAGRLRPHCISCIATGLPYIVSILGHYKILSEYRHGHASR